MKYDKEFLISYLSNFLNNFNNRDFITNYVRAIPEKFYRFRQCREDDFDSIDHDYIWLSLASEFNDVKDSTIRYNLDLERDAILSIYLDWLPHIMKNEMAKKKHGNSFSDLELNMKIVEEYKSNILDNSHAINYPKLKMYLISKGLKGVHANLIIDNLNKTISSEAAKEKADQIITNFKKKMQDLKDYYYVTCFTETYENDNLWETYADKYTGFCVEYDFDSKRKDRLQNVLCNFAPMLYDEKKAIDLVDIFTVAKKHYCGEIYDENSIRQIDITMNLHSRTKSITYDHEMEWRLFQKKEVIRDRKFDFPYISRIILGKDIKKRNKSRLVNIAKSKGIDVYQQEFNFFSSSFNYYKI